MPKKDFSCYDPYPTCPTDIMGCNEETRRRTSTFMTKVKKTLDEHQRDIEDIVKAKGGRIVDSEWRLVSQKYRPYFYIECDKNHKWWAEKFSLMPKPSKPKGSWCPHPDCRGMTLDDHQKDIEGIVKAKGGKIIDREFRFEGGKKIPYYFIECDEKHRWWVRKDSLMPSNTRPNGSWCPRCPRGKSLDEHQREIESIVKRKGGTIIDRGWFLVGQKKKKKPYFYAECFKAHKWWVYKGALKRGTWCPICQDRISAIGTFGHIPIEYFSLVHLNSKGCKVEHEKILEEGTRPDLVINRDDNFKFNIEKHQNVVSFSDKIKKIAVDFTFSLVYDNISEKCFRNYQSENRFLLIVLLRENGISTANFFQSFIESDIDIENEDKKRVKVINFDEYLDFLNLGKWNFRKTKKEKKIESSLRGIITLCIKSIDSDTALATLQKVREKYANLIGIKFVR